MIHFSELIMLLLSYFTSTGLNLFEQYFIFIDIYGRYVVYQKSLNKGANYEEDLNRVKTDLTKLTGPWLDDVCNPEDDYFATNRIKDCLKNKRSVLMNVWIEEVFKQNFYWEYKPIEKQLYPYQHIVSFYSYKGGTGRTTAMLLTALAMAHMGKKVLLLDFDIESAGLFQFFSEDQLPKHGILDYLVDSGPYKRGKSITCLDDYLSSITDAFGEGIDGSIDIIPACGTELLSCPNDYMRTLLHTDLDLGAFRQYKITPLDYLISAIHDTVAPDYILVDSRSGIHQIAGITMNRYSSLALPFFSGNQSNAFGMKLILPTLIEYGTPYMMIHAKMPNDRSVAEKERQDFLQEAYDAACYADENYSYRIDDPKGKHFPFELPERPELANVSTLNGLLDAYPHVKEEYEALAKVIMHRLPSHRERGLSLFSELERFETEKAEAEYKAHIAALHEEELAEARETLLRSTHEQP